MNKEFKLFQDTFKKYQEKFGLGGYNVYFKYEPVSGGFACVYINHDQMCVTVTLDSNTDENQLPFKDILRTAKHECLHLLTGRLEGIARERYANEKEIDIACEELAYKLEKLIPDIK